MTDPADMKAAILEILSHGPSNVPDITRAIWPELSEFDQQMRQHKVRHHLYMMEKAGIVDRDARGKAYTSTWWVVS
ncbi:MAG: helix-turn-helix transcriptional regulator [Candidatus Methanomethylophilaceae archaeon]|nr:helix-turn-helix transcriptional regulator [Candidatus Methanomethylophilaceae archaeon]